MALEQDRMLKFFNTNGLENPFYSICRWYEDLAKQICIQLPVGAERTVALRKLLESRDCAVRALVENVSG